MQEVLLTLGEDGLNAIQLLQPLAEESPVQRWLNRNGGKGGLHHLGLRVGDVHQAYAAMKAQGFRLLDAAPRAGSWGTTVFFVHPKGDQALPGLEILLEVVQK